MDTIYTTEWEGELLDTLDRGSECSATFSILWFCLKSRWVPFEQGIIFLEVMFPECRGCSH